MYRDVKQLFQYKVSTLYRPKILRLPLYSLLTMRKFKPLPTVLHERLALPMAQRSCFASVADVTKMELGRERLGKDPIKNIVAMTMKEGEACVERTGMLRDALNGCGPGSLSSYLICSNQRRLVLRPEMFYWCRDVMCSLSISIQENVEELL